MSHTATNKSTHDALQATLKDLQIRSVVEETVKSMLVDVELATSLQDECQRQDQMTRLERQVLAAHVALEESRVVQESAQEERTELADALVQELWSVSQELGALKRWKKTHQDTVMQERDELMAKLLQATDELEELKKTTPRPAAAVTATVDATATTTTTTTASTVKEKEEPPNEKVPAIVTSDAKSEESASPVVPVVEEPDTKPAAEEEVTKEEVTDDDKEDATEQQQPVVESAESHPAPAVSLVMMDDEDEPLLETFEESILLEVFSFLDALEIVNLAQVNIALYSRVDSLFGIGEDSSSSVPTEISTPTVAAPPTQQQQQQQQQATIVQLPPPAAAAKKPTPVAVPKQQPAAAPAGRGGLISLFQTSKAQVSGGGGTAAATTSTTARGQAQQSPSSRQPASASGATARSTPLSAAMANSMAEKLNDKEINAIISMTEKLNQRNKEADQLTRQAVELRGKLDGTEAIKNFLVTKVREMEQSMSRTKDLESKTAQQIASDQEVISFLDSRVRELERSEASLISQHKAATDQLVQLEVSKDQKITVLSDMIQYERERQAEQERDYKATKKVLVKEVKSCRATIMALQAERDGLQQQNERLKRAVMNTASSSGMNGSPKHHSSLY